MPSLALKEAHALVWPWLSCIGAMMLPGVLDVGDRWPVAMLALGAPALGAVAIGHEYAGKTLPLLLSQPVRRERLYVTKLAVLAIMLAVLLALGYWRFPAWRPGEERYGHAWLILPTLGAFCVTPWLTMVSRSPVAGAVFTLAVPGLMMTAASVLWQFTGRTSGFDVVQDAVLFGAIPLFFAFGAMAGWRAFMRLEVKGDQGAVSVSWPQRTRAAVQSTGLRVRHRPMRALLAKEFRLQQLSLTLAAVFAIGWLLFHWQAPPDMQMALSGLTLLYALLISVLIGMVASAEERQLGTLESQILLPVSAARQWLLKIAVVFTLATILALALPGLLEWVFPFRSGGSAVRFDSHAETMTRLVLLATAGSLYLSSLSGGTVNALTLSIGVLWASAVCAVFLISRIGLLVWGSMQRPFTSARWQYGTVDWLLGALFIALICRLAFVNHRTADLPARRIVGQAAIIAAAGIAWILSLAIAARLLDAGR
jgi:hypothetical protein